MSLCACMVSTFSLDYMHTSVCVRTWVSLSLSLSLSFFFPCMLVPTCVRVYVCLCMCVCVCVFVYMCAWVWTTTLDKKKRTILEIRGEKNAVPRVISCSITRDKRRAKVVDSRGSDLAQRCQESLVIEHDITRGTAFLSPRISTMVLFFVQGSMSEITEVVHLLPYSKRMQVNLLYQIRETCLGAIYTRRITAAEEFCKAMHH